MNIKKIKKKLKYGDYLLIVVIIVLSLLSVNVFTKNVDGERVALITRDGEVLERIYLEKLEGQVEYKVDDKYNIIIEAEKNKIRFKHSECPDKVCVLTGWITKPGQTAVCLPSGIIVKIIGETGDLDITVG